jgi:hypothetical protein
MLVRIMLTVHTINGIVSPAILPIGPKLAMTLAILPSSELKPSMKILNLNTEFMIAIANNRNESWRLENRIVNTVAKSNVTNGPARERRIWC